MPHDAISFQLESYLDFMFIQHRVTAALHRDEMYILGGYMDQLQRFLALDHIDRLDQLAPFITQVKTGLASIRRSANDRAVPFAVDAAKGTVSGLNGFLKKADYEDKDLVVSTPTEQKIRARIYSGDVIDGKTWDQFWQEEQASTLRQIRKIAKPILTDSEPDIETSRQVIAKMRKDLRRWSSQRLATAMTHLTQTGRIVTYEESGVVEYVRWVSTLDKRTSNVCALRDGKIWEVGTYKPVDHSLSFLGGPPAHRTCRSATVAYFQESLGVRASYEGPDDTGAFLGGWFQSLPEEVQIERIGPGRHRRWKSGSITLEQAFSDHFTLEDLDKIA